MVPRIVSVCCPPVEDAPAAASRARVELPRARAAHAACDAPIVIDVHVIEVAVLVVSKFGLRVRDRRVGLRVGA